MRRCCRRCFCYCCAKLTLARFAQSTLFSCARARARVVVSHRHSIVESHKSAMKAMANYVQSRLIEKPHLAEANGPPIVHVCRSVHTGTPTFVQNKRKTWRKKTYLSKIGVTIATSTFANKTRNRSGSIIYAGLRCGCCCC